MIYFNKTSLLDVIIDMVIMAVDLGKVRTGIAVCDKLQFLASPLCVIEERNQDKLAEKVVELAVREKAELVIVGLPKNMDGSEGESAKNARMFAGTLTKLLTVPVHMQDERCTTITAHRYLNDTNVRGKKRKQTVDAVAATVILQSYIDSEKTKTSQIQNNTP